MLFGGMAVYRLPVERYPAITPPTVVVATTYPGASAKVVADTVAAPIEQQVNGVEDMMHMSSTRSADGSYSLTVAFEIGTNLDDARAQVQNLLSVALPTLPEEVRRQGVTVKKKSPNILLVVSLVSPSETCDGLFRRTTAPQLRDELRRGVGEVTVRGVGAYAMRVWLNPDDMAFYQLTTADVVAALARQNMQVAAGQVGQPPSPTGQSFQQTVTTLGRLTEASPFGGIIVQSGANGELVYPRDVARVVFGAQTYDSCTENRGLEATNILICQLPGSNAMDVAARVRDTMERLEANLPDGMEYGTWWHLQVPTGFLPAEDEGYALIAAQLPDGASLDRTREVTEKMNKVFARYRQEGKLENGFALGGLSLLDDTAAPNGATAFTAWTDWSKRTDPSMSQEALVADIQKELGGFRDVFVIVPPSIPRLDFAGGFEMKIEDKEGVGLVAIRERTQALIAEASKRPEIAPPATRSTFRAGVPEVYPNIDREKAEKMGVSLSDVFGALQANLGSVSVNDFNKFDRTYTGAGASGRRVSGERQPAPPAGGAEPERRAGAAAHLADPRGPRRPAHHQPVQPVPGGDGQRADQGAFSSGDGLRRWKRSPTRCCRSRWGTSGRRSPTGRSG